MAYTVSIAPLTPTAIIGATTKFTATGAGAAVEGTESFVWSVNGVTQSSVIATMDYIAAGPAGSKVVKVVATTTPAEGEPETAEAETTITVNNKTMSATATLTTSTPTVKVGDEYKASANVTGTPSGATVAYLWSTGETTKDITRTATVAGPISLTCKITISATDYNSQTINPSAVTVTVENRTMTATGTLSTSTPTVKVGQQYKASAAVASAPSGATIAYLWSTGETTKDITRTATVAGPVSLTCRITVSAEGYNNQVINPTAVVINVENKTMTATATLTTSTPNVKVGQQYKASANITGAPDGATFDYLWSTGETTKDITRTATVAGPVSLTCRITISAKDYNDQVINPTAVVVTVENNIFPEFTVGISGPSTATVDVPFNLTASISPAIPGATLAYKWDDNSTAATRTISESAEGLKTYTCEVTVSQSGFTTSTKTGTKSVTVEEAEPVVPEECPLIYVHPLPIRNTAYIWCGWWVMDAIQKLTFEGKDWKKATKDDTPYYCHLAVLAKMLNDYPEVDVQESRNGRIIHRSALDAGIIYDYIY